MNKILAQLTKLNVDAAAAITKFAAADDEDGKKSKLPGEVGAVAGAATVGAGVHKAVMNNAKAGGAAPGVGAAYKTAAADVGNIAKEAAKGVQYRWRKPMNPLSVNGVGLMKNPAVMDRVKSAGAQVGQVGKQLVKKMIRTVTHYSDPTMEALAQLNVDADAAVTKFCVKG